MTDFDPTEEQVKIRITRPRTTVFHPDRSKGNYAFQGPFFNAQTQSVTEGDVVDFPKSHAEKLIRDGVAEAVAEAEPEVEAKAEAEKPATRGPGRPAKAAE